MEKLIKIQRELIAPKSSRNDFGKYNYRNCEQIFESVKPLLEKYGCTLTVSDELVYFGNRYYIKATATITDGNDSKTVTSFAREAEIKKGMDESQITGSASSYARKYALCGLFLIDGAKDADALNVNSEFTEWTPETDVINFLSGNDKAADYYLKTYDVRTIDAFSKDQYASIYNELKAKHRI